MKVFLHSTSTLQFAAELMQQRSSALLHVNALFALACCITFQEEVTPQHSFKSLIDAKIGGEKVIDAFTAVVNSDEFRNAEKSRVRSPFVSHFNPVFSLLIQLFHPILFK